MELQNGLLTQLDLLMHSLMMRPNGQIPMVTATAIIGKMEVGMILIRHGELGSGLSMLQNPMLAPLSPVHLLQIALVVLILILIHTQMVT